MSNVAVKTFKGSFKCFPNTQKLWSVRLQLFRHGIIITCDENCDQGGFPVAISIIVQPTDQISAIRPWPVCFITSGAIQYDVPLMLLTPESAQRATCMCLVLDMLTRHPKSFFAQWQAIAPAHDHTFQNWQHMHDSASKAPKREQNKAGDASTWLQARVK